MGYDEWGGINRQASRLKPITLDYLGRMIDGGSFDLIKGKLSEDIDYHVGIQAITFLDNRLRYDNFVAL